MYLPKSGFEVFLLSWLCKTFNRANVYTDIVFLVEMLAKANEERIGLYSPESSHRIVTRASEETIQRVKMDRWSSVFRYLPWPSCFPDPAPGRRLPPRRLRHSGTPSSAHGPAWAWPPVPPTHPTHLPRNTIDYFQMDRAIHQHYMLLSRLLGGHYVYRQ